MKIKFKDRRKLREELFEGKEYIFRGASNNKYQSNYSNKVSTELKSRFFAWELFDSIYTFGNLQVFELLDSSNILNLYNSIPVEDFIKEENLQEYNSKWLKKIYGINNLSEMKDFDYHDEYHSMQIVATDYLENNTSYDGACWYESMDDPEEQIQIWNYSIIRKLSYQEAKVLMDKLAKEYPGIYDNSKDEFGINKRYNLSRGKFN